MTNGIPEMIDLAFDLEGGTLPADYPFALWSEIVRHAPQLAKEKFAGVLPLRTAESNEGLLLAKRAKLVLRIPTTLAEYAAACLPGKQLNLAKQLHVAASIKQPGEGALLLGEGKLHKIHPFPTIHAQLVTGASDELIFTDCINSKLSEMGIAGKLICGKRRTLTGDQQTIHGFSLVIHDLKPEASLQLQYAGLGEERHFGCGVFVPHKVISGL
jgi:CRISPR-associated protein Cas6